MISKEELRLQVQAVRFNKLNVDFAKFYWQLLDTVARCDTPWPVKKKG